jgi:hypothetical protein
MTPTTTGHGAFPQNNANSPYTIETTGDGVYVPGGLYNVTIKKGQSNAADFKGFMCQARKATGDSTVPYGEFTKFDTSKVKTLSCSGTSDAVTHINRVSVSELSMEWRAPSQTDLGPLRFYCTVVQQRIIFYAKLPSASFDVIAVTETPTAGASTAAPVRTTSVPTTTGPTTGPTTFPPSESSTILPSIPVSSVAVTIPPFEPTATTDTLPTNTTFTTTMAPTTDAPVIVVLPSEEDVAKFKEYFEKWVEYFMMWKEEFEAYKQECRVL